MFLSKIWYVSDEKEFLLGLAENSPFQLDIIRLELGKLADLEPEPTHSHLFFIVGTEKSLPAIKEVLRSAHKLQSYSKIVLLPERLFRQVSKEEQSEFGKYFIGDDIPLVYLQSITELLLNLEHYRVQFQLLLDESYQQKSVMENVISLASQEVRNSVEEKTAYSKLLEYKSSHVKFFENMTKALEKTRQLRIQELLHLKQQLEATEKLSDYRHRVKAEANATLEATEAVMDLSRQEGIEREKIIKALENLNIYSEKQLFGLFGEVQSLREKLGLPPKKGFGHYD